MINWATKYDYLGNYNRVPEEPCTVCSKKITPEYSAEQSYFTLYGLPLFALGVKYFKVCDACSAKLKARASDGNLREVKRVIPGKIKLKYVWGWIVLLPAIAGIILLILEIKNS